MTIRHKTIFIIAVLASLTMFNSCIKEQQYLVDGSARLSFSEDTVMFDTVFATMATITRQVKVYNNYDEPILIDAVTLKGGSASRFRINVDGDTSFVARDVEISAHDSIFLFVEALFSHKIFIPTTTNPDEICKNFRIEHMADTTSIVSNTPIGKYTQQFDIDINNYRLTMSGLQYENQLVMAITYGMLKSFDKILFPETVHLQTTMTKTDVSATLNIEKIKFNEPLYISPINTARYKKVGFMDLLKK